MTNEIKETAKIGNRMTAIVLGVLAIIFGVWCLRSVGENFWIRWLGFVLFVTCGCGVIFFAVRGKSSELNDFSPVKVIGDFGGEVLARGIIAAVIIFCGMIAVFFK